MNTKKTSIKHLHACNDLKVFGPSVTSPHIISVPMYMPLYDDMYFKLLTVRVVYVSYKLVYMKIHVSSMLAIGVHKHT